MHLQHTFLYASIRKLFEVALLDDIMNISKRHIIESRATAENNQDPTNHVLSYHIQKFLILKAYQH